MNRPRDKTDQHPRPSDKTKEQGNKPRLRKSIDKTKLLYQETRLRDHTE